MRVLPQMAEETIRKNYDNWKRKIDEVKADKAILSVRYWSDKPYRSKSVEFLDFDKDSEIGVDKFCTYSVFAQAKTSELARNDGLSMKDFLDWFRQFDRRNYAIVHFTKFRYLELQK